ncbi:hypothetical protein [Cellulomonas bogoriensis]|uniref:Uncharacterized protein n=1 Tax=Cellulomonas bogoriensis 69B4 = DSM 16987 TaxID=1386082 RepID=A0A0A0BWE7_9CELL|nr:hypothetical protein [Cellulomonas bogoriensis]KGM12708.1 hypothetical protein N869_00020 [Cellulomonas bogoriensis 69B4 = DSM 16987]
MSPALVLAGVVLSLAGGAVVFVARSARHRFAGLVVMAAAGLGVLVTVAPVDATAPIAAVVGLPVVVLLLVVVRHLERAGRRASGADLDLDGDPGR